MGASGSNRQTRAGRLFDPVFLCMVGAMVLAVASSVTLRAVMAGAGQLKSDAEEPKDWGKSAPAYTAGIPHKAELQKAADALRVPVRKDSH